MKDSDLKIESRYPDWYRKGGQQCGLIPMGIKVTHVPTGLYAYCSAERSQSKNKRIACEMLEWGLGAVGWKDATRE